MRKFRLVVTPVLALVGVWITVADPNNIPIISGLKQFLGL